MDLLYIALNANHLNKPARPKKNKSFSTKHYNNILTSYFDVDVDVRNTYYTAVILLNVAF